MKRLLIVLPAVLLLLTACGRQAGASPSETALESDTQTTGLEVAAADEEMEIMLPLDSLGSETETTQRANAKKIPEGETTIAASPSAAGSSETTTTKAAVEQTTVVELNPVLPSTPTVTVPDAGKPSDKTSRATGTTRAGQADSTSAHPSTGGSAETTAAGGTPASRSSASTATSANNQTETSNRVIELPPIPLTQKQQ